MSDLIPLPPGTLAVYNVSDKPNDIAKLDADDVEGRDCLFALDQSTEQFGMDICLLVEVGGELMVASELPGFLGTTNRGQSLEEFIDPKKSRWLRRLKGAVGAVR